MPGPESPIPAPRGLTVIPSHHARKQYAERFPDALTTFEDAVHLSRVVAENRHGAVLWYAFERAAFVCNRAGPALVIATVLRDCHLRPIKVVLSPRLNKNQRKRLRAMHGGRS